MTYVTVIDKNSGSRVTFEQWAAEGAIDLVKTWYPEGDAKIYEAVESLLSSPSQPDAAALSAFLGVEVKTSDSLQVCRAYASLDNDSNTHLVLVDEDDFVLWRSIYQLGTFDRDLGFNPGRFPQGPAIDLFHVIYDDEGRDAALIDGNECPARREGTGIWSEFYDDLGLDYLARVELF